MVPVIAGCGTHHSAATSTTQAGSTSTTVGTTTTAGSPTTSRGATTTTASPHGSSTTAVATTVAPVTVTLTESDDTHAVSVRRGDVVVVVLHSTYWSFTTPTSAVVAPDGAPVVAPMLQGCVPGGGCGTVTARYRATAAGQATLSAHRDSCGEALRCTGRQGDWQVQLTVS
jgi:hypothetical protein